MRLVSWFRALLTAAFEGWSFHMRFYGRSKSILGIVAGFVEGAVFINGFVKANSPICFS